MIKKTTRKFVSSKERLLRFKKEWETLIKTIEGTNTQGGEFLSIEENFIKAISQVKE